MVHQRLLNSGVPKVVSWQERSLRGIIAVLRPDLQSSCVIGKSRIEATASFSFSATLDSGQPWHVTQTASHAAIRLVFAEQTFARPGNKGV